MDVDMGNPGGGKWTYQQNTYYFSGPGCTKAFLKEPEGYVSLEIKIDM